MVFNIETQLTWLKILLLCAIAQVLFSQEAWAKFSLISEDSSRITIEKSTDYEITDSKPIPQEQKNQVSTLRYVSGGVLSIYPGLGVGHLMQGRWSDRGWIFTLVEPVAILGLAFGMVSGRSKFGEASLAAFLGLKIWEFTDAWFGDFEVGTSLETPKSTKNYFHFFEPLEVNKKNLIASLTWKFKHYK